MGDNLMDDILDRNKHFLVRTLYLAELSLLVRQSSRDKNFLIYTLLDIQYQEDLV